MCDMRPRREHGLRGLSESQSQSHNDERIGYDQWFSNHVPRNDPDDLLTC